MRFIAPPRVAFRRFLVASLAVCGMALVVSCGDEASDKSPVQAAEESSSSEFERSSSSIQNVNPDSSEAIRSSSSICEDCDESSSSVTPQNVTLSEAEGSSSSETSVSSSSAKSSSSSAKVEDSSSSAKVDESSSSMKAAESSSSVKVEESSSSEKNEVSSSSEKPVESSSSEKVEESSSSENSSSSSIKESSSSVMESSSSSRKVAEIKPNNYYKTNCPEGVVCKYVTTEFLNQEFLASNKYGEILDERDGLVYKTIKIDNYNWTAQNMNYDTTGFCQDDIPLNCEKYGRIYNKNVAIRICPFGWHLPDSSEWRKLIEFAQKYANVENAGSVLKSQNGGWSAYLETNDKEKCDLKQTVNCIDGNGSDELGFSAVPQAEKANTVGGFSNYGHHSSLWMKKPYGHFTIYFSHYFGLGSSGTGANYLHSVRCIKD